MARYSAQVQRFGIARETTRGTAETSPAVWIPTRGFAKFNFEPKHVQNPGIRGVMSRMPHIQTQKMGEGQIPLVLDAQYIDRFFQSLLGDPTTAQQAATAAYKHTFVRGSGISPVALTTFIDRSSAVHKQNLTVVKKIALKGNPAGLIEADIDVLFKNEASGSIGSPSYATEQLTTPVQVSIEIGDVANTDIMDFNLSLDNGAKAIWTLNGSQYCDDILTPEPMNIEGGFKMLFSTADERDAFLANTTRKIEFIFTGNVIASTYYYTTKITVHDARYTKAPYGEEEGLLAVEIALSGFYSTADSKDITVEVTNTTTTLV
jgi:hypothetical protein